MTTIDDVEGTGTPIDPWQLTTPPGSSPFEAFRDPDADPPALVVQVGKTQLRYHLSCIEDLHREPGRRLVRLQEGPARTIRKLRASGFGSARARRGRTQCPQQPHARDLTRFQRFARRAVFFLLEM